MDFGFEDMRTELHKQDFFFGYYNCHRVHIPITAGLFTYGAQ